MSGFLKIKGEEGHYTIKRIKRLPKRGNANWLYHLKSDKDPDRIEKLYRYTQNGKYEEILVGADVDFQTTSLDYNNTTKELSSSFVDGSIRTITLPLLDLADITEYTLSGLTDTNSIQLLKENVVVSEIDLSVLENSQLNLQEVTDNGNETTNSIVTDNREGFILRSGGQRVGQLGTTNDSGSNFGVLILNEIGNGEVSLSPNSSITYSNTSSRSFLPDNQQKVLAVSVNGLFADQFGDISLPIGGSDYVSDVQLTGNSLSFTGVGNGFNGSIDLSSISGSAETNTNLTMLGTSQNQDLELQYQNELGNNQNINLSSIINRSGWQDLLTSNRNEIGRFYSNIDTSVFSTGTSIYETLTEFLVTEVGGKITNFGYRSEDGTVVEIDSNKLDVSSSSNVFEDTQLTSNIVTPAQSGLVYTLSFQKIGNIVFVAGNIINNGATIPSSEAILNITNSEYFPSRILALISSNTSALGAGSSDRDYYMNVTDTSITPSNSFIPDSGGFLNGHNIIINGFYFTN